MHLKFPFSKFNTSQRLGVVALLFVIVALQLVYHFADFTSEVSLEVNSSEITAFQNEIDSLKRVEIERRKPKIYPFNPSFITDYKGYKLGMKTEEIDRLLAFRKRGKYINSAKQFQQVTKVSDSLLLAISPYFKFPDWVTKKRQKKYVSYQQTSSTDTKNTNAFAKEEAFSGEKIDLNSATAAQLQKVRGVGVKLAARILKYKKVLKGYTFDNQLYEVWYLDREVADRVMRNFTVRNKPAIERININTASFKEVLRLPYIDYELTKKIFNKRDELAEFESLQDLKKIDSFPVEKFDRISLYLKAE